jgi:hypothetical protein
MDEEEQFVASWKKAMDYAMNELYYVADDTGLVMLDNVDFETAYVYADKHDGCGAYRKIKE